MEKEINPKGLKQTMNKYRYELESFGVSFESKRSNGQKYVAIKYDESLDSFLQKKEDTCESASSVSSDSSYAAIETFVPFVPCDPDESRTVRSRDAP
jgi:hypothetical protein